ncbi:MAG TPA: ImcF-related family protein, partial [Bryobacteraceae bacterium]|nr:ImcF-related family protein [Bryobacteraceae bacterium]
GALKSVVGGSTQSPRAALLCFDCERFLQAAGTDQLAVTARNLQARLGDISQTLGISLPVYVLFSRTDRIPFFSDYVRTLSNEEATQVLGATLPLRGAQSSGVYAEDETQRLNAAFNSLFHNLCDKRVDFMPRENDAEKQPGAYEFPREFRKLRSALVQFLVDVCRPSQLRASPFLRGFYFSGVRPVVVNEMSVPETPRPAAQAAHSGSATGIFNVPRAQQAPAAQPQFVGTKKVPQWLFLSHLFHGVILQDRAAMGASGSSTKTSKLQRFLLAALALLCVLVSVAFLVSWMGNRKLVNTAVAAAQAIPASEASGSNLPSAEALKRLDNLRESLEELTGYHRDGAPLRLRGGLYTGDDLYPLVRKTYYTRFAQLLFGQTQAGLHTWLQRLPAAPSPADEYGPTYDTLKGYLITTSHHDKSTKAFLSPLLLSRWSKDRNVDPERMQLAQKQFDFYSEDLKASNPYSSENDAAAVDRGRRYLSQFSGSERVYQFMLAEASKKNPPINFNRKFPGSADVVINNRDVMGAYTKGGWAFMKDAIRRADQFFGGEKWVLGDYAAASIDRAKLEQDLQNRYVTDFIAQWRAYLKASVVTRYANLKDAGRKLNIQSGNQSPILALFWLASQNTGVDSPKVTEAFQPVHFTVPPANVDRYVAPSNQPYMNGLVTLQSSIDQAANMPGAPDPATVSATLANATSAKIAVKQIAQNFRIDQEAHVEATVQKLLEEPITNAEGLLRGMGPAELNGKGKGLCSQFNTVTSKFPFNSASTADASIAEVNSLLKPGEGALWSFYEMNLKTALVKQGAMYVPNPSGGVGLNPAFVNFFNTAARLSEALYAGGSGPKLTYTVKLHKSENIASLSMILDGQPVAANDQPKQVTWPGPSPSSSLNANVGQNVSLTHDGVWSAFRVFNDADRWENDGTAYNLDWTLMQSFGKKAIGSGATPGARLNLNLGSAPMFFHKGSQGLQCVATVAR